MEKLENTSYQSKVSTKNRSKELSYFILIRPIIPAAAVELELFIPIDDDDVELESTTLLGGAGAIFTSFDLTPRAILGALLLLLPLLLLLLLLVGDDKELLLELGTIEVLLVGDALIVMDFVVTTAVLLELVPYDDGDAVPEALSNSIIAS